MKILFRKKNGDLSLGIEFFWTMTLGSGMPASMTDHFIPDLFFDYFFIKKGSIQCVDQKAREGLTLPQQVFKTIHTKPLTLRLSNPLELFGARFSLAFAESFWEEKITANSLLKVGWVRIRWGRRRMRSGHRSRD
jgi:hypothetical protein